MKKLTIYLYSFFLLSGIISCDKIDNRDIPAATIKGELIDVVTNQPLITEQPNGFRIRLMEYSWSDEPTPLYFWGKADGTFQNTKIFDGNYGVKPIEGAFFDIEEQIIDIKGTTNIDFKVIPYLSISEPVVEVLSPTSIKVSYKLSRQKKGDKILDTRVFITDKTSNVGSNIFTDGISPKADLSEIDDDEALAKTFEFVIENLTSSNPYYMRIGARTNNPQKRYNFTKVVEIKLK